MQKRTKKWLLILGIFIGLIFFPTFDNLESTYIPGWTWPKHRAINENNVPRSFYFYGRIPKGIFLTSMWIGGNEAKTISKWSWLRIRFGLPLRPITLDIDKKTLEWHLRHEGLYFTFNIIFWIVLWMSWQFFMIIYRAIKNRMGI